ARANTPPALSSSSVGSPRGGARRGGGAGAAAPAVPPALLLRAPPPAGARAALGRAAARVRRHAGELERVAHHAPVAGPGVRVDVAAVLQTEAVPELVEERPALLGAG